MRVFICTVGTSIATNNGSSEEIAELSKKKPAEVGESTQNEKVRKLEVEIKKATTSKSRLKLSAEIKSLAKVSPKIDSSDAIYLLCGDDAGGLICAKALRLALTQYGVATEGKTELKNNNVIIRPVDGLQVYDRDIFSKEGVRNLFDKVIDIIYEANSKGAEVILNPTGGYKSAFPYITLAGILFKKKTIYIFEESEGLIELPPVPLNYDAVLMSIAYPYLIKMANQEDVTREDLPKDLLERADFNGILIEEVLGLFDLTPLGSLFYNRYIQEHPPELPKTKLSFEEKLKNFKMPSDEHHDNQYVEPIVKKMLHSSYIEKFLRGERGDSTEPKGISKIGEKGEITFNTGNVKGSRFTVKTTGRTKYETRRIAEDILKEEYF